MKITFTKNWSLVIMMLVFGAMTLNAQTVIHHEEFNGGIPGTWTVTGVSSPAALWTWSADGTMSTGAYWGAGSAVNSASVANGAVGFNSDFLDNGGVAGAFGQGAAPGPQVGELISPIIDCSNHATVAVRFNQIYRNFSSTTTIEVSGDGGLSWTPYQLNDDVGTNDDIHPSSVAIIDVSSVAAGSANVQVKFVWNGNYYYWLIDDFELITIPNNNMVMESYLFPSRSQYTPLVHVDSMTFEASVSNDGLSPQPNTWVKVEVSDDVSVVFADSTNIGTLPVTADDSTFAVGGPWIPSNTGTYSFTYSVRSDSMDYYTLDNSETQFFQITDSLFSKERTSPTGSNPTYGRYGGDYVVANYYRTSANYDPSVDEYYAKTVTFAAVGDDPATPIAGQAITAFLYEVTTLDDFSDFDVTTDDNLTIVGSADYTFAAADDGELVTLTLTDFNTNGYGVLLKPDTKYFLALSYSGTANQLYTGFGSPGVEYFQLSTFFKAATQTSGEWALTARGDNPVIKMGIENIKVSSKEVELPASTLNVFPNPANDYVTLDLNFDAPVNALVTIMDASGKVLRMNDYNNITSEKINYNTADFAAGTYIVRVSTKDGVRNQRFVVTH